MREIKEFIKYLKRKGKKNHVVDGLIKHCNVFEEFLQERRKIGTDDAGKEDILAFFGEVMNQKVNVGNSLRAISLYYRFALKPELSAFASGLREQKISSARKAFKPREFRGVNDKHIMLLEREGIATVDQMLEKGKAPRDRRELSRKTGIPLESILEYVKLSDLGRIEGVKGVRARLYFDASVDTLDKLAGWDSEELRKMLVAYVERTGFDGMAPLPKEAKHTVEAAKRLERIVEYEE